MAIPHRAPARHARPSHCFRAFPAALFMLAAMFMAPPLYGVRHGRSNAEEFSPPL